MKCNFGGDICPEDAVCEINQGCMGGWTPYCEEHGGIYRNNARRSLPSAPPTLPSVPSAAPVERAAPPVESVRPSPARPAPLPAVKNASDAGLKYDAGKPGVELLPFESLIEIAKVLDFGAKKYEAHNWRKGMAWSRLIGAALRHLFAYACGQDKDPETGLSHLAHAGCCVTFLLSYQLSGVGKDDRYRTSG